MLRKRSLAAPALHPRGTAGVRRIDPSRPPPHGKNVFVDNALIN